MVSLWIAEKARQVAEGLTPEAFRRNLEDGIMEAANWSDCLRHACRDQGVHYSEGLATAYHEHHRSDAFNLIPCGLHAEFCWIPEWNGGDLDSLMYDFGLQSDRSRSTYIEDIHPDHRFARFLRLVNQSSVNVIGAAIAQNPTTGRRFAEKAAAHHLVVHKNQNCATLMTPDQVIAAVENAYWMAVPVVHCEINVRSLFTHDPQLPMLISTCRGEVHVGWHQFLNGAGYMDTYKGSVEIPANAVGFVGATRWKYGINEVYGLYRPVFHTVCETPMRLAKAA